MDLRMLDREVIDRLIANESRDLDSFLNAYLSEEERELVRGKSRKELAAWIESVRGFLRADGRGKFQIDKQAQRFGISIDSLEFIPALIDAMGTADDRGELAKALRQRYVPVGLEDESQQAWRQWWEANREYLFFTDTGGFRWQLDPLAKNRGIPTSALRGPARATREPIVFTSQ